MSNKHEKEIRKLTTARIKLLANHPFFGDLAFGMPIEWDDELQPPTAATNGERIIFHPEFVRNLPMSELVFVLAHEVMHVALLHVTRRKKRCAKKWNYACDVVVNYLLVQEKVGTFPSIGIYSEWRYNEGEGKVEKIFDLLPDMAYGEPGSGHDNNGSLDSVLDADPKKAAQLKADMQNKINRALNTAKKRAGKVSKLLEEFVEDITTPKVSWQDQLRSFVLTTRGAERTWAKRNRRYIATDILLPGSYGETIGEIAFLIDCSGSVSNTAIAQCAAEVKAIQEEFRPENIHVLYFDTIVKKHEEYGPDDMLNVKAYGCGGTVFRTSFEYMDQHGINPEVCIVATDLECNDYGPQPSFPVLWCAIGCDSRRKYDVPWGQVLFVK